MGCRWGLDLLCEHLLCSPACRVLMATHSLLHSADYQGKSQRSDHTGFWRPLLPTYPTAHSRAQCEQGRDMCSACRWGEMSVSVHWITIYTTTHQGQSVSRGSWEESWASVQKDRESCCHGGQYSFNQLISVGPVEPFSSWLNWDFVVAVLCGQLSQRTFCFLWFLL